MWKTWKLWQTGFDYSGLGGPVARARTGNAAVSNLGISVSDIIQQVKNMCGFWLRLPRILCQNPEVGAGVGRVERNCWTGRDRKQYTARLIGDGLAAQQQNPEVVLIMDIR